MGNTCAHWLGCCWSSADHPLEKDPTTTFHSAKRRSCTDVPFLLLYVGAWIGVIAVLITAVGRGGDPRRITHGVNYNNTICSGDTPYAAWVAMPTPEMTSDCTNCYQIMTCIATCNDTLSDVNMVDHYESESLLHYCVPTDASAFVYGEFSSVSNSASRAFVDLYTAWPVILGASGIAVLCTFIYIAIARRYAGVLVAVSLLTVISGGFLLSYALLRAANDADATTVSNRSLAMKILGYTIGVITGLFLVVVFALRQRIQLAVEVVKESSSVVLTIPTLMSFPIIPFVIGLGYFAFFIVTSVYIVTVWTATPQPLPPYILNGNAAFVTSGTTTYTYHAWDSSLRNAFIFVFFHLLWTMEFLLFSTFLIVSGTVANWYFAGRDAKGQRIRGRKEGELSYTPIIDSSYRTIRFHLGTVAFGSLIIAVILFIRFVVAYIEARLTPRKGPPNCIQKALFTTLNCCLAALQRCMEKVSKNAMVWTAIWGDAFCPATISSFKLIWSNLARVAMVTMVATFIMTVGKILVALLTTGISGIIIYVAYNNTLSSIVLPIITVFLLSYLTAALFMNTLDTTIDTVLLCFLVDEMQAKETGRMMASEAICKLINAHSEASFQIAKSAEQIKSARDSGIQQQQVVPAMSQLKPGQAAAIGGSAAPSQVLVQMQPTIAGSTTTVVAAPSSWIKTINV